jgi:hypothetical protein
MEKIGRPFSGGTVYLVSIPCLVWRYLTWFLTDICTIPPVPERHAFPWTVFAIIGGSILHAGTVTAQTPLAPLISILTTTQRILPFMSMWNGESTSRLSDNALAAKRIFLSTWGFFVVQKNTPDEP